MIVRRFLLWARNASPGDRADAVAALAKAYLYSDLSAEDRWEAETALTAMLDDRSAMVRCAMAESLAKSPYAPRHIMVALAGDQPDVAAIVLARSPILIDADLVDAAALGDERIQCAVASRPHLSPGVSAALAEIAGPAALAILAANPGADISEAALIRTVARHGASPALREALIARPGLPADVAQAVAAALAASLQDFVVGCGWLSSERGGRVAREARERTAVTLSSRAEGDDRERLVSYLRASSQLTPGLILRAILSRELSFADAAFAELAAIPLGRASAILCGGRGQGFRALFARAGLPEKLRPAFESALEAARASGGHAGGSRATLSRRVVEATLAACDAFPADEAGRLVALLRRFEVEAARDEARRIADELADDAALQIVLEYAPDELVADARPRPSLAA